MNTRIIHDFLFGRTDIDLMIHVSRRSNVSYDFWIGNNQLQVDWLQIEVDAFFEGVNTIASVEVKSIKHTNFEIRQIYSAMRYLYRFYRDNKIPQSYKILHLFVLESKERGKPFY